MPKVYQILARTLQSLRNCTNEDWIEKYSNKIKLIENNLPSGSGINSGCKILVDNCNDSKIVIQCDFHHMDDNGYYCGWTEHKCIITPDFNDFNMKITGNNKNMIKDYLFDTIYQDLNKEVKE